MSKGSQALHIPTNNAYYKRPKMTQKGEGGRHGFWHLVLGALVSLYDQVLHLGDGISLVGWGL